MFSGEPPDQDDAYLLAYYERAPVPWGIITRINKDLCVRASVECCLVRLVGLRCGFAAGQWTTSACRAMCPSNYSVISTRTRLPLTYAQHPFHFPVSTFTDVIILFKIVNNCQAEKVFLSFFC